MFRGRMVSIAKTAATRMTSSSPAMAVATFSQRSLFSALPSASIRPVFGNVARRFASSEASKNLATVLGQEKKYEEENPVDDADIKEALKALPFKVEDVPRKMEVTMTRKFEGEDITVFFSVEPKPPVDTFGGEDEEHEEEGEENFEPNHTFFSVLVSKPNGGTITFSCTAEEGSVVINQVVFTQDPKLAIEDTAQADYLRTNIYPGPNFVDLDEGLQDALYEYLLERLGDDEESFSNFIPAYTAYKEQQEYQNWLSDLHKFVSKSK